MNAPPRSVPPRFLLVNAWHDDNKGDAAITLGTIRLLRERWAGAVITVAPLRDGQQAVRHLRAAVPDAIVLAPLVPTLPDGGRAIALGAWAVRIIALASAIAVGRRGSRLATAVAQADVVVLVGGSNLFDIGTGMGLSTLRLLHLLLPAIGASRASRPVWVLGHTLGPFDSRLGHRLAGRVLRRAQRVVVREALSLDVAVSLGVHATLATDLALALRPRQTPRVTRLLKRIGLWDIPFAAFTIRRSPYGTDFDNRRLRIQLTEAMARIAIDRPALRFVVVAQVLGPTRIEDDRVPARDLFEEARARLGADRVALVEDDLTPEELSAVYGAAEVVVGERFHSVLLALAAGTPAYAISYFTTKAGGIMADLGLGAFHAELADVDGDLLGRAAIALCHPDMREVVADAVAGARRTLDDAFR